MALAGLVVVGAQAHSAGLPAERTLRGGPASPEADGLGGWTWAGRRAPAPVPRGERTLIRLELNTSLVSPPVWVPAAAQAMSVVTRSPGGGTLLVVRAEPLDGGRPVELGVLEPRTRPLAQRVAVGSVAGRPVRLVLDPVTAFGRVVEVGEVGPFLTTMPGWRVTRGLVLRSPAASRKVVVPEDPLVASRGFRVGRARTVSVRVRGAGAVELRVGVIRRRLTATAAWRTLSVPAPPRGGRVRVELRATPGAGAIELADPGRVQARAVSR